MYVPEQLPCSVLGMLMPEETRENCSHGIRFKLELEKTNRCKSLKISCPGSAPHVRQTELYCSSPVPNQCLQVFRKQLKALHKYSEEIKSEHI